jgi:hypothetical protein
MWCWIMCWSALDNREAKWKNQPETLGWENASHITRLLPSTRIDYPVQYRWEISLPLLYHKTSSIYYKQYKIPIHARGLLYLTSHRIHDYKLQTLHPQDFTGSQQLARRVFIDQGVVYIDQVYQQIQPDNHQKESTKQWKQVKKKVTSCEATAHQDDISKRIFQHCATHDHAAFTTQQPTTTYL